MGSNIATGGSLVWCSTFISTGCAVSKGKLFFLKLIYKIIFSVMNIPQKKMYIILLLSASVVSDSVRPHRRQPIRLPRPWDSPGKNTGVGCHFLLQCMNGKSENEVAQLCPTLSDPMDCSPPGSSIHGIFQARVLELGAIAFSV